MYKTEKFYMVLITYYFESLHNYNNFKIFITLRCISRLCDTLQMRLYLRFNCVGFVEYIVSTLLCQIHSSSIVRYIDLYSLCRVKYISLLLDTLVSTLLLCWIHSSICQYIIMSMIHKGRDVSKRKFCNEML